MKITNWKRSLIEREGTRGLTAKLKRSATWVATGLGTLALTVRVADANEPGTVHYPDLQTLTPYDFKIQNDPSTHRKLLRFSNAIANLGDGPMELVPHNNESSGTTDAYQILYSHDDGGDWYEVSSTQVGTFVLHPQHDHWHFEDFARYELRNVKSDGSIGDTVLAVNSKVSFCLRDSSPVDSSLEHSETQTYLECNQIDPQGISVGWSDVYSWNLFGQSLDITGLPNGDYWVVSTADPDDLINEGGGGAESNNTAAVKVRIKGSKATVRR